MTKDQPPHGRPATPGARRAALRLCLALGLLACASSGQAQFTVPGITITPSIAPSLPKLEVAEAALIQPARIEARMATGFSVANINFTVVGDVLSEVTVEASDPALVLHLEMGKLQLRPNVMMSVSGIARAPHKGVIRVRNSRGEVIASAPYEIGEPKRVNQNASVSYSPKSNQLSLGYSASMVPQSMFDPRVSASVSLSLNATTGEVGGSVSINVGW